MEKKSRLEINKLEGWRGCSVVQSTEDIFFLILLSYNISRLQVPLLPLLPSPTSPLFPFRKDQTSQVYELNTNNKLQ